MSYLAWKTNYVLAFETKVLVAFGTNVVTYCICIRYRSLHFLFTEIPKLKSECAVADMVFRIAKQHQNNNQKTHLLILLLYIVISI